jgi:hypothetical protein
MWTAFAPITSPEWKCSLVVKFSVTLCLCGEFFLGVFFVVIGDAYFREAVAEGIAREA